MSEAHDFEPRAIGDNLYIPSSGSLARAIINTTDYDDTTFDDPVSPGSHVVMVVCTEQPELEMANGRIFSTGNHPVETFLPMLHLEKAGFDLEFYTPTGKPVVFEKWLLPNNDPHILGMYQRYLVKWENPHSLADLLRTGFDTAGPVAGVYIPGGHGAVTDLPFNRGVGELLKWAFATDRHIISLCHGPAAFLAAGIEVPPDEFVFRGYSICAFPTTLDKSVAKSGYIPGEMPWYFGPRLEASGVTILNDDVTGRVHTDRRVITGDGPAAGNALGRIAARALLDATTPATEKSTA